MSGVSLVRQFCHEPIIRLLFNLMNRAWINRRRFLVNRHLYIFLSSHFTGSARLPSLPPIPNLSHHYTCRMRSIQFEVASENGSSSWRYIKDLRGSWSNSSSSFDCLKWSVRTSKLRRRLKGERLVLAKHRHLVVIVVVVAFPDRWIKSWKEFLAEDWLTTWIGTVSFFEAMSFQVLPLLFIRG